MELKNGFRVTALGLLPEDWNIKPFVQISYMKGRIGWQGLKQTEFTTNSNEPFLITGMNFKDGEIRWEEVYHVSEERYEIAKDIQLKIDDVLMTKDGTIGKLLYVSNIPFPYKATLNSHLLVFRPIGSSYYPKYLYYQLDFKYFKEHIELSKSGTTFFGISQQSVGKFNFPLPPLPEQKAIAEVLSDTDNLIQSLEKQIAKKRLIKQGAMQKLLTPKEGWEEKRLGDVGDVKMCRRVFNHETETDGTIPFYKIGTFGKEADAYISKELYDNYRRRFSFPKKGDILISAAGTIGRTLIYDGKPAYFQDSNIVWIDNNAGLISNNFLYYVLKIVKYNTEGGTIQRLYNSILRNAEFVCPPRIEQTHITTILSDMDKELEKLETKLSKYKQLKQGLMQNLLTGKIRLV